MTEDPTAVVCSRALVAAVVVELRVAKGAAEATADRFDTPEHDTETGRFLVKREREDAARLGRLIEELAAALAGEAREVRPDGS
jgi:hypothetical protein